ncbi:MAG: hypothetical protein Q7K57_14995 [Burkholderiaceae bacterium]|nr:hypothetical protein [Burkholderiaceae bacterium]
MAVLAIFTGIGITKPVYESLRREVAWETRLPPGLQLHTCGFDDKGNAHVADVWESAEVMNDFVSTRLMPAMKKLGAPEPSVVVYPVHNLNVTAGIQKYLIE